jgi:hypothetical protein
VTERDERSRHQWWPPALSVFFGAEPRALDPLPGLSDVVAKFAELSGAILDEALADVAGLDGVGPEFLQAKGTPLSLRAVAAYDLDAPMRVVLMGRTMAGKSSLLSAMTGGHLDRVGDGRQRFSRDVFEATAIASERIEIVDTPGVGARDGAEDFDKAFSAALDADLILWVASSDSIQDGTARALRLLSAIGKPIVVVLNCRQSLEGVGKLNLLRFPERVFGNRDGLIDEIKRHMADAAVEPLDVVYVHALAAAQEQAGDSHHAELHAASRIDELTNVLLREHASHSRSRRALRLVDTHRRPVEGTALSLATGAAALGAHAERDRAMAKDIHARLARIVSASGEAMTSDIAIALGHRRDWHLTVTDFGDSLPSEWEAEVSGLQEELGQVLQDRVSTLAAELQAAISDADTEWASASPEQFALGKLRGFDEVWGNRLLRAGIGIGGAIAGGWAGFQAGAAIGAAIGLVGGPAAVVTAAVSGLIGLTVGAALKPMKGLVSRLFLGKDGVLKKRRDEIAVQVGPILDDLSAKYTEGVTHVLDSLSSSLAESLTQSEARSASLNRVSGRWMQHGESLRELIHDLDRETTSALLRIAGRERLARSVKRSTRVPGVCIVTEFEPLAFWEAWLFPPDIGEKLVAGKAAPEGGEAAGSLSYALGLLDHPVSLIRADSSSATLLIDEDVPANIAQMWADSLTTHIGKKIHIELAGGASSA